MDIILTVTAVITVTISIFLLYTKMRDRKKYADKNKKENKFYGRKKEN